MWVPVHNEEWDQDVPLDDTGRIITTRSKEPEHGSVVFEGSTLPWTTGLYEVMSLASLSPIFDLHRTKFRYHHDGKHNVLSLDGPCELYGTCSMIRQCLLVCE